MARDTDENDAAELIKSKLGDSDDVADVRREAEHAEDETAAASAGQQQGEEASTERFQRLKEEETEERLEEMEQQERAENEADIYDPEEEGNILH